MSVPLYHHLKMEVLKSIQDGTWTEGDRIPSEAELAEQYHVSRITVRQALGDLVSLGYLSRRQGKGTFVTKRRASFAASGLHGFAEELRARGHEVSITLRSIRQVPCPEDVRYHLNVQGLTPVIEISRVASVSGNPVFRDTSFLIVPSHVTLEEVTRHTGLFNHIYGFFEQSGVRIAYGRQQVAACRANQRDIDELRVLGDEPILRIRRVTSDEEGTPVEFSEVRYPANLYQYEVNLIRDSVMAEGFP